MVRVKNYEISIAMRLLLILMFAGMTGCDSVNYTDIILTPPVSNNPIDFSDLSVGQHSIYLRFEGGNIYDLENAFFEYKADTLIVEVVSATDSGYVFRERITPGSVSLQDGSFYLVDTTSYHVAISGKKLKLSAIDSDYFESNLFLAGVRSFTLQPLQDNEIQLNGVLISSENEELYQVGFVLDHTQFDKHFDRLNVVKDWRSIVVDGPGFTMVYSQEAGVVRAFSTSPWTGDSRGWDLASF